MGECQEIKTGIEKFEKIMGNFRISVRSLKLLILAAIWGQVVAQDIQWESLSGPYYRQGCWWPICIKAPLFQGSSQKLVAVLDRFQFTVGGEDTHRPLVFAYFLISSPLPVFSLTFYEKSGEERFRIQKTLDHLHRLEAHDSLVGIYGSHRLKDILSSIKKQESVYFHSLPALPDSLEGLKIFRLLIWDSAECSESEAQTLKNWIHAGGNLLISNPHVLQQAALSEFLQCERKMRLWQGREIIYARLGLGSVAFSEGSISEEELVALWPLLWGALGPLPEGYNLEFSRIFTPGPCPQKEFRNALWLLSSTYFFIAFGLCCLFLKRFPRTTWAMVAMVTAGFLWALYEEISRYLPVDYQRLTFTRLVENQKVAIQTDFHYFASLKDQSFACSFPDLPMPISALESPTRDIILSRDKTGWMFYLPHFGKNESSIWQTQRPSSLIGKIVLRHDDGEIHVTNGTPLPISDCLYLKQVKPYPIALSLDNFTMGETVSFPKNLGVSCYHFREPWATERNSLTWVVYPVMVGRGPYLPPHAGKFAGYRQKHIVWFTLYF